MGTDLSLKIQYTMHNYSHSLVPPVLAFKNYQILPPLDLVQLVTHLGFPCIAFLSIQ